MKKINLSFLATALIITLSISNLTLFVNSTSLFNKGSEGEKGDESDVLAISSSLFNDRYYSKQWNLDRINYESTYNLIENNKTVRVAIIDGGIDKDHIDSPENINETLSKSFASRVSAFNSGESVDHGTAISGIIAAKTNNYKFIVGINSNVEIISVAARSADSNYYDAILANAINYCESINVDIINLSVGGYDTTSSSLINAIANFSGLIVVPAGNQKIDTKDDPTKRNIDEYDFSPACLKTNNMIVVGGSSKTNALSEYSNYGRTTVDLFAPGESIATICSRDHSSYYLFKGTSFAVPQVVGAASLIMSTLPSLTVSEVKSRILNSVTKVAALTNYCSTGGILNTYSALHYGHIIHYSYYDTSYHYENCNCGYNVKMGHTVAGGSFINGQRYATCIYCGGNATIGYTQNEASLISDYDEYSLIDGLYYPSSTIYYDNGIVDLSYEDYLVLNKDVHNEKN